MERMRSCKWTKQKPNQKNPKRVRRGWRTSYVYCHRHIATATMMMSFRSADFDFLHFVICRVLPQVLSVAAVAVFVCEMWINKIFDRFSSSVPLITRTTVRVRHTLNECRASALPKPESCAMHNRKKRKIYWILNEVTCLAYFLIFMLSPPSTVAPLLPVDIAIPSPRPACPAFSMHAVADTWRTKTVIFHQFGISRSTVGAVEHCNFWSPQYFITRIYIVPFHFSFREETKTKPIRCGCVCIYHRSQPHTRKVCANAWCLCYTRIDEKYPNI